MHITFNQKKQATNENWMTNAENEQSLDQSACHSRVVIFPKANVPLHDAAEIIPFGKSHKSDSPKSNIQIKYRLSFENY